MTEHIKLITEEVNKTLPQIEADWAKSYAEKEEAKKNKQPIFVAVLGYTEQKIIINGHHTPIHRVFVQALDSGSYSKLGWVLKKDVTCCMICSKAFTNPDQHSFFSWGEQPIEQIHCRACGNIVCTSCYPADALVEEIQSLGPVPVCCQCFYGQDEVKLLLPGVMPPSYRVHQMVAAATAGTSGAAAVKTTKGSTPKASSASIIPMASSAPPATEDAIPRIWKYGNVYVEKVIPVFCFEARTKDKVQVYINVCSAKQVPYNLSPDQPHRRNAPLTKKGQDLMMLIGEKGISATIEGAVLYDVALHPSVFTQCSTDATGVLKEKICAEIVRSLRRVGHESEFVLFTYLPSTEKYHLRHLSYQERLAAQGDEEIWRAEWRKSQQSKSPQAAAASDGFGDLADDDFGDAGEVRVYLPMPSISAFFHMEQIAVGRADLKRPPGQHEKRWAKYCEITQLEDGTLYIPNNKRAKKVAPLVQDIPMPVLLSEAVHDSSLDLRGNRLKTFSAALYAFNGFVIHAHRAKTSNNRQNNSSAAEELLVHVLHHPFVDDFTKSGILDKATDDLDPLLMLNTKTFKIKKPDGTSCRAYNVLVGSSYIVGVDDLTGRRILAPERIAKILRRINSVFADDLSTDRYTLSGVDKRPVTDAPALVTYVYERPLYGSAPAPAPAVVTSSGSASGATGTGKGKKSKNRAPDSSWDAASSVSELSQSVVGHSPPSGPVAMSTESRGDEAEEVRPSQSSETPRQSNAKMLRQIFLGSRSASKTLPPQPLGPSSSDVDRSSSLDLHDVEHKSSDSHDIYHQRRPSPLTIPPSPKHGAAAVAQSATPHGQARGGGIAELDADSVSSKRSGASAVSPHKLPTPTGSGSRTPSGGLGFGNSLGISLEVQGIQQTASRNSIASNHSDSSDFDSQITKSTGVKSAASAIKSIFLSALPSPLHRSQQNSGDHAAAALEALNADETPTLEQSRPDSGRPPSSNRHSLRAFFTRENSGASVTAGGTNNMRHSTGSAPISASHSRSGSMDARDSDVAFAAALTPSAGGRGLLKGLSRTFGGSGTGTPTAAASNSASTVTSPSATPRSSGKISGKVKTAKMPGKELVTPEMMEYVVQMSVNRAVAEGVIKQSAKDPTVLFGWQIRVSAHMQEEGRGLYVVTAVNKSVMGVHDFRLTNLLKEDIWVKLKRGTHEGLLFTPMRKVLVLED